MKTPIDKLTNEQLSVLAALGQGWEKGNPFGTFTDAWLDDNGNIILYEQEYDPCNNWSQAGELVERYITSMSLDSVTNTWTARAAWLDDCSADDPKLAIVRAFVASKYGTSIDYDAVLSRMGNEIDFDAIVGGE